MAIGGVPITGSKIKINAHIIYLYDNSIGTYKFKVCDSDSPLDIWDTYMTTDLWWDQHVHDGHLLNKVNNR